MNKNINTLGAIWGTTIISIFLSIYLASVSILSENRCVAAPGVTHLVSSLYSSKAWVVVESSDCFWSSWTFSRSTETAETLSDAAGVEKAG